MNLLEVKNLSKAFTAGNITNHVLKDISFSVKKGEFIAVMGQSGSGKSTLLYNISGMDHLTDGQVYLDGVNIADKSDDELADIRLKTMGFIFQNNYLLKNLNIADNICLPGFKARLNSAEDVVQKSEDLMRKLGIIAVKSHAINKVSGGQLQRAAVSRALINNPQILFADEPTGALNSKASSEVVEILNQLNAEGMTILVVTHDAKVASATDRIIYLKDGNIEDQLMLGKYRDDQSRRQREEQTLNWLLAKGF